MRSKRCALQNQGITLTLIQYDCMIQMFCPSLKASNFACLTAANSLNCEGGKHSFVMIVM